MPNDPREWNLLKEASEAEGLPVNALVARIDAERLGKLAGAGLIQPGEADGVFICGGDCDDGDAATYPGAPEVCGDGVD